MAKELPPPIPTPAPTPAASAGVRDGLKSIRAPKPAAPKVGGRSRVRGGLTTLAAVLGGVLAGRALMRTPTDTSEIDEAVNQAVRRSKGERVAKLLEQARMERTLAQNQARLAQANPTLYTSVMAGRKVPTGAVVLGGRPRTDLMRELAASMDSGAFQKRDPLSDLMG